MLLLVAPIVGAAIASGVASLVGSGINAYQNHREKKRQEQLDAYNKELAERNYQQSELFNSPSYQKQRLMEAGYNPLVSGDTPSMNSATPQGQLQNNPMPTTDIGSSVSSTLSNIASTIMQERQQEIDLQGIEVQQKQLEMQRYKIETDKLLNVVEKAIQLYHQNSITKDELNDIISATKISVSGVSLTAQELESRIKKNQREAYESEQRALLLEKDNAFRSEYNRLVNKKLEVDIEKTSVDTQYTRNQFDIQRLQKKQAELVNYKMEVENYFSTLDIMVRSLKPDGVIPPNVQIQVAEFLSNHSESIISNLRNSFLKDLQSKEYITYKEEWRRKNHRSEKVKIPYRRSKYDDYTDSLNDLSKLQQKAINGELEQQDYWYIRYLLGAGATISKVAATSK